jgi:hypothetical protein
MADGSDVDSTSFEVISTVQQHVQVALVSATRTRGVLTEPSIRTRFHVWVSLEVNNNAGYVVVQARTVR